MVVFALPPERAGSGPSLDYQIVGFLKPLAVMEWVDVGGQTLNAGAANESRNHPTVGDHVDLRYLFGYAQGVLKGWQWVAHQHNLGLFRVAGQDRRFQIHGCAQAGGGIMVLVEHKPIEAGLLAVFVFVQVLVVLTGADLGVEIAVGEGQPYRFVGAVSHGFLGIGCVGPFGEPHQEHVITSGILSFYRMRVSGCSALQIHQFLGYFAVSHFE